MKCNARILGLIESELRQGLELSFSVAENLSRPGSGLLGAGDRFRFCAWIENRSGLDLQDVRGTLEPTRLCRFTPQPFALAELRAGSRVALATLEGAIAPGPRPRCVRLDRIARVELALSPDLSAMRLRQSRPLTYVRHDDPRHPTRRPGRRVLAG